MIWFYLVTPLEDNNKYKSIYCYLPLQIYRTHLFCIQRYLNTLTKLRSLPDQTRVWCAHEYTLNNLKFALTVDPNNAALQQRYREVEKNRAEDIPTIPAILGTEKLTNPFLRWDSPALAMTMDSSEPVQVFARLRGKKDNF